MLIEALELAVTMLTTRDLNEGVSQVWPKETLN
jgi:hypothetical protein